MKNSVLLLNLQNENFVRDCTCLSITGKQRRIVPFLLTADIKKAMDLIANMQMKTVVGVSP